MDVIIFSIMAAFAFILFVLAFFRNHALLSIFSGISFILLGIFSMNGIKYVSIRTINSTLDPITTVTPTYSTWIHTFGSSSFDVMTALSFLFVLFGLFLILVAGSLLFSGRARMDFGDDDVSED